MNLTNVNELQEQIRAGGHEGWNKAVSIFGLTRTPLEGLEIRGAFLVLAFRHGKNDLGLVTRPNITKDNALKMIAESYQGASRSSLASVMIDRSGKPAYPLSEGTEDLVFASIPVGLAFVGPCRNGIWADEVLYFHVDVLAEFVGRTEEEELQLLEEFVFDIAERQIQKLQSN